MIDASALVSQALAAIGKAQSPADLDRIEIEYLGRKSGHVSRLLSNIGALPAAEKAALGKAANEAKRDIEDALATRRAERKDVCRFNRQLLRFQRVTLACFDRRGAPYRRKRPAPVPGNHCDRPDRCASA